MDWIGIAAALVVVGLLAWFLLWMMKWAGRLSRGPDPARARRHPN
jgi:hypothetical protein